MSVSSGIHFAYIDEAGNRGMVRNLTSADDHKFGLMAALVFPDDMHEEAVRLFTPAFEKFQSAAPAGAKLHITDAFKPGNEDWAAVATEVREEFIRLILDQRPMIVYGARRFKLSRLMHENNEKMRTQAREGRRSKIKLVGGNRPSDWRIEDDLVQSLSLRLDGFAELASEACDVKQIDLLFDETDAQVAQRYEASIQRTRNVSNSVKSVRGWDPEAGEQVEGMISMTIENAPFRVDTKYLGDIRVIGKSHPLVLAADIVANHLHHHLSQMPADAPLHHPASIADWRLRDRVWGVSEDASDDLF